jgi:hypothetical protein
MISWLTNNIFVSWEINNNYDNNNGFSVVGTKVVNTVSAGVSFFQLERNVSVSERFGVPFRDCTVHLYIYIYIQDKLIINYALQSTNTMSNKHNFKI